MNHTKIEWALNPDGTPGYTWNPITGCLNGCEYCYARKLANTQLKARYLANTNVAPLPHPMRFKDGYCDIPFYPRFWEDRIPVPINYRHPSWSKKPRGIFVCDMSDLFGIGIPEEWTRRVLRVIKYNPQHRFYLLTKQPQNLAKFSPSPDNCWVGVTATNMHMFIPAINWLDEIEAKIKYISCEPLLGCIPINHKALQLAGINWIIIGAQTKPTVMPKIEWVREIVEAADKAGIPVFLKDNLNPMFAENDCKLFKKYRDKLFAFKDFEQGGNTSWHLRQEMPE